MLEEIALRNAPIVVLDVEATGLYEGLGNRVVEVGAVRYEGWHEVGRISQLVNPRRKMEPQASAVCGITDADLVGMPQFSEVADDLLQLLDGAVVVAHNADFDARFIGHELLLAGKYDRTKLTEPILPNPWLCTLMLARKYFHFGRNNLTAVATALRIPMRHAHRALNDVYVTAEVCKRMTRELEKHSLKTVGDLLDAQGGAIYTAVPKPTPLPSPIDEAAANEQKVDILYLGDEMRNYDITPRYAAYHRGTAYLIAYCHERQAQHAFQLDRIFSATVLSS